MKKKYTLLFYVTELLIIMCVSAFFDYILFVTIGYNVLENPNFLLTITTIFLTYPLSNKITKLIFSRV